MTSRELAEHALADVERAIARIRFSGGVTLWKPRVTAAIDPGAAALSVRLTLTIPHRDTGGTVVTSRAFYVHAEHWVDLGPGAARGLLLRPLHDLLRREVDEALVYDGERPFGPEHVADTSVTGPSRAPEGART